MNHERQGFHIWYVYSLGRDFYIIPITFDLVTLTSNFESHTLNVAIHIWLPLGELRCLLTTLVKTKSYKGNNFNKQIVCAFFFPKSLLIIRKELWIFFSHTREGNWIPFSVCQSSKSFYVDKISGILIAKALNYHACGIYDPFDKAY